MSKLAIIFPREGPKSPNEAMLDISIKYYTGYFRKNNFSVADCLEAIYANCGDFLFISKL